MGCPQGHPFGFTFLRTHRAAHSAADWAEIENTATCFPALSTVANSWDKKIAYKLGEALGKEAAYQEINIVLGPGVNIKRSPLCGRNFEYFSEDPYLTGHMGAEYVKGLQKNNIGACVKHFAANNQENRRRTIDVVVDERALREIYLKAFEIIVEEAKPWAIMSAYNKVNGQYCSENKKLIDILKKEWNFDGIVITDWGAVNDRVKGLIAGNELEMPGGRGEGKNRIIEAIKTGKISEELINEMVDRILQVGFKKKDTVKNLNMDEQHKIALEIAEESIVLLRNEEKILPLNKSRIIIVGDMAKKPRYQGAGSSTINPYKIENAYECFKESKVDFSYAKGYNRVESVEDEKLRVEAVELAKENIPVVIFAGLTENYESEGMDRENLDLPRNQNELIDSICRVNDNVIVVLSNGSPVTMPWKDKVKAIVIGQLGGEAGARAMTKCLFGEINPSGKLAETYPLKIEDTPCYNNFPGTEVTVEYKESIFVGYRYYETKKTEVLYPFGFGLSYTNFEYYDMKVQEDDEIRVAFKIKNIGDRNGKEIAQVYISQKVPGIFKPAKELKAFEKIELNINEEKEIIINLKKEDFSYYNVETRKWEIENGIYKILVGKSSRDIVLEKEIEIKWSNNRIIPICPEVYKKADVKYITDKDFEQILGYKIPNRYIRIENITEENTLEQIRNTKVGKIIYDNQIKKMNKLLQEQNVNKATKVMMDMQKPLKKFYEKKNGKYTKEMIEELIFIAKENLEGERCEFLQKYINN